MNRFRKVLGACLYGASCAVWTVHALSPASSADELARRPSPVAQPLPSIGDEHRPVQAGADPSGHLARQYALHRSSLYLYNPGRIEWLARAPGTVVEQ